MKTSRANNPLVSIIVITYNSAKFVLETLESAKAQSYENIELIVSDDASTDDTVEICSKWIDENKERFVRTELITVPENTGIPANCNRGVKAAKGEWVKFIAGDDALYEDAISKNIDFVTQNPQVHVVFSSVHVFKDSLVDNNVLGISPSPSKKEFFLKNRTVKEQYVSYLSGSRFGGITPSAFLSKKSILSVDGFDERFILVEDAPLWFKLLRNGYLFHFNEALTVKYRRHSESVDGKLTLNIKPPSFLRNEKMRKEYVYPYLTIFYFYKQKYEYWLYWLFNALGMTTKTKFLKYTYFVLLRYCNPFDISELFLDRVFCVRLKKHRI